LAKIGFDNGKYQCYNISIVFEMVSTLLTRRLT